MYFRLITNSRKSVFITALDFMNPIIMVLKLSVLSENNRQIFLVRLGKYFVSQASYNPTKSYEVCQGQKKGTAGKMSIRLMNVHFPVSVFGM